MSLGTVRLSPNMDMATLATVLNQNFALLENINVTQVFKDETGVNRILLGRRPNGTWGQFVSKVGIDVLKAEDDELIFNSNQNTLKVITTDTITLTRTGGTGTQQTVVPAPTDGTAFYAWATLSGVSPQLTYPLSYYAPDGTGGLLWGVRAFYDASVGAVTFIAESYDAAITATTQTFNIKYYLMQETLI